MACAQATPLVAFSEEHRLWANSTYGAKYHVQRHGNVEIQGVVVHHADSKEHGYHDDVVPGMRR